MICRHFGACGGCQSQGVPYAGELETKRDRVIDLLGSVDPTLVEAVRGMPVDEDGQPWRFRQKAAFAFGPGTGRRGSLVMGHYAAGGSHGPPAVMPVSECPVHAPRANRLAFRLRDRLAAAGIAAAGADRAGILRHVIVRTTRDEREAVVMLVVTRNDRALRRPINAFLAEPDPPSGFLLNIHERPGPYMVGPETLRLAGRSHVRERALGPAFLVSPAAFFQTNVTAAGVLLDEVLGAVPARQGRLLDLYSGSGLFALPLAARGWTVTAVEENRQAMRDAEANARLNRVAAGRLRLLAMRVEQALERLAPGFDIVVLDPPRQGCPPRVIDAVFGRLAPRRAIYVCCNPAALGAELPAIARHGYGVTRVLPVDMFPHTDHVELVATLERRRAT